eukprot:m51a1_g10497 hypothetical protein (614) ;mRNA; f:94561-96710
MSHTEHSEDEEEQTFDPETESMVSRAVLTLRGSALEDPDRACEAISVLASHPREASACEGDAVGACIGAAFAFIDLAPVIEAALFALAKLAIDPYSRADIWKKRGGELLCESLRQHGASAAVCQHACALMLNLALHAPLKQQLALRGCLSLASAALRDHAAATPAVAQLACAAVGVLAVDPGVRRSAALGGLGADVLRALVAAGAHAGAAEAACGALWNLLAEPEARAQTAGGVALALVRAMQVLPAAAAARHTADESVQQFACAAIGALAPRDYARAGACGCAAAVLASMELFADSCAVQHFALDALARLADDDALREKLGAAGAVAAAVGAMRSHGAAAPVQQCGSAALCALLAPGGAARAAAAESGALDAVLAAAAVHSRRQRAMEDVCAALWNMSSEPALKAAMGARGAVRAVLEVARALPASDKVQQCCLATLWNLSMLPELQRDIVQGGGLDVAADALRSHPSAPDVVEAACGALWAMSSVDLPPPETLAQLVDAVGASRAASEKVAQLCLEALQPRGGPAEAPSGSGSGECSARAAGMCEGDCAARHGLFCADCCRQGRFAWCATCDGHAGGRLFCQHCIATCHQGHDVGRTLCLPAQCSCNCNAR